MTSTGQGSQILSSPDPLEISETPYKYWMKSAQKVGVGTLSHSVFYK
jgi:hypothetical protein